VKDCLSPQLQNQEGRHFIKASTPPPNLGHVYYDEREIAAKKSRLITKTIYDNEALTKEELQEIIEECGGIHTPSFRRERLCEQVADPDMLVIPEFVDSMGEGGNVVPNDYPRPEFFTPYVGGDSGADDFTAMLFGYYDFSKNEIVVENELVLNGKTTEEIIENARIIERDLWGEMKPRKRVYDAPKQLILDLFVDHKYPVAMPDKADKHAAIHDIRVEVGKRRFKVKERCTSLRRQLKVGLWKDERHSDFERTEGLGHLDAIAAAIYLNRCIDRRFNPIPQFHGANPHTHHVPTASGSQRGTTEEALNKLFGPKARRIR
jgi:hypothetical protein